MQPRARMLLDELTQRTRAQSEWLLPLLPAAERILDPRFSESERVRLMEVLAEAAERAVQLRRSFCSIQAGFDRMFGQLVSHAVRSLDATPR